MPSGTDRPSFSYTLCTEWYGPAISAVTYVDRRGVGAKTHTLSFGSGVGELEMTVQPSGAFTVNWNVALRSGCSKLANTRRASGTSNCVYRYAWSSTGSTKRCRPSPVLVYAQSALTRSTLRPRSRPGRAIRESAKTSAGSSASPFRVISWTAGATRSMKDSASSAASKRTVVTDR
ncbi:hypothetical protein RKD39_004531 [Streptomyces albogriseolus]